MTNIKAIILDTETDALEGNPIEIAYYPLELSSGFLRTCRKEKFNQRFSTMRPIDLGAMATHNILDEDLIGCPSYTEFKLPQDVIYIVGHNIDYDIRAIRRCGHAVQCCPIDTLALARTLLPDAPGYKLAILSYYLAPDRIKVREFLKNAHSALADIDLTAALLIKLIELIPAEHKQTWEDLYNYSLECRIPKVMPFGEHKGKLIDDVPQSYKQWLMNSPKTDMWLKLAIQLNHAHAVRRTYEINQHLPTGTYQDYQFLYSSEPVEVKKRTILEATLLHGLRAKNEIV